MKNRKDPNIGLIVQIKDMGSRVFQGLEEGSDHFRPVSQKQDRTKVIEEMRDGIDFGDF